MNESVILKQMRTEAARSQNFFNIGAHNGKRKALE